MYTIATFRDHESKMHVVLVETTTLSKIRQTNTFDSRIDFPEVPNKHSDEDVSGLLASVGYKADKIIFMADCLQDGQSKRFVLAPDVVKTDEPHNFTVHTPDIITVNSWLGQQTQRDTIIGVNVWAGLYLRIAYLVNNPISGKIQ